MRKIVERRWDEEEYEMKEGDARRKAALEAPKRAVVDKEEVSLAARTAQTELAEMEVEHAELKSTGMEADVGSEG